MNNPDLQPPDLWLHHNENMELKHPGEKSSHEIVSILKHSNEYTNNINLSATLDRLQKRTNSVVGKATYQRRITKISCIYLSTDKTKLPVIFF